MSELHWARSAIYYLHSWLYNNKEKYLKVQRSILFRFHARINTEFQYLLPTVKCHKNSTKPSSQTECNIKPVIRTRVKVALFRRPQPAQERKHRKQIHKAVLPRLFDKRGNIAQTKVACFQKGSGGWGEVLWGGIWLPNTVEELLHKLVNGGWVVVKGELGVGAGEL